MIKLCNGAKSYTFEYCYLFIIVIYLAQMTPRMGRMVSGLTGDWLILFIPIILTIILCIRNKVKIENTLIYLLLLVSFWSFLVILKKNLFTFSRLNDYVFLLYAVIVAYIQAKVYGKALLIIYEDIILRLCKISFVLWSISIFLPGLDALWQIFPETTRGNNVLYVYHWIDPSKFASAAYRNAGCSWEPGRFAIMIIIALTINLLRNGLKVRNNKAFWWFIITIISTFSTTGYSISLILISIFWIKLNIKSLFAYLFIAVPLIIYIFSLDFMTEKIVENTEIEEAMYQMEESFHWYETQGGTDKKVTLGRFQSIYYDATVNIVAEPLLGYGLNYNESEFSKKFYSGMILCGNFLGVFSRFGLFMGLFWYCILFKSSKEISKIFNQKRKWIMFLSFILISVSYQVFYFPVWTSIWLYGLFKPKSDYIPKFYFES